MGSIIRVSHVRYRGLNVDGFAVVLQGVAVDGVQMDQIVLRENEKEQ